MKLATAAVMSLFVAGCLCAQAQQSETTTTTRTVNLNGTLIDQGCYTSRTEHKDTSSDANGTTTTTTTKITTECPVTTTTTSFGLLTPEGKVVHFDDASNTRVVEMLKSNKTWADEVEGHKPLRVRVVAMPNGDVMVIKDIK